MKVRLLTPLSGAKGSFAPGDEYECSEAEAERLVTKGFAESIKKTTKKTII